MKKDMLKGIIRDFHVEPLAELFDRDIEAPLSSGKIISLVGVGKSGKTSFLLNFIGKLKKQGLGVKNVLYLNFEDERLDLKTDELDLILQAYRKYLRFNGVGTDLHSSRSLATINNLLHKYLDNGGFPGIVTYDDKLREKVLQEYFNVMIYRGILERYEIKNAAILKFFIKRMLASSTKQLSVNTIYNELKSSGLKIGKNPLYEYLDACREFGLR